MGRRKKSEENGNLEFDEVFGEFRPKSVDEESESRFRIMQMDGRLAQPCAKCGRYPRLHFASFKNAEKYPSSFYVDCGCGECDGEWYPDKESALSAWNEANLGARPRGADVKDSYDFIESIMETVRFYD